jgi:probable HAF family extracellular repeat protein
MHNLVTLPAPYNLASIGNGVNDNGQVTGVAYAPNSSGNINEHAFLYSGGVMTDLGTLGGQNSSGNAINASGQVAGTADMPGIQNNQKRHAFLYSGGVMTDLGTLEGFSYSQSYATAINASGQITGNSDTLNGTRAFLYAGGVMTNLGTFGGGSLTEGEGINSIGQVTGWGTTSSFATHAFLYSSGTMTDLNTMIDPTSGWVLNYDMAINALVQITVDGKVGTMSHAFLLIQIAV